MIIRVFFHSSKIYYYEFNTGNRKQIFIGLYCRFDERYYKPGELKI